MCHCYFVICLRYSQNFNIWVDLLRMLCRSITWLSENQIVPSCQPPSYDSGMLLPCLSAVWILALQISCQTTCWGAVDSVINSYGERSQTTFENRWFDNFFEEPKFKVCLSTSITCNSRRVGSAFNRWDEKRRAFKTPSLWSKNKAINFADTYITCRNYSF